MILKMNHGHFLNNNDTSYDKVRCMTLEDDDVTRRQESRMGLINPLFPAAGKLSVLVFTYITI